MSALAAPFNDGLAEGRLRFQRCQDCRHAQTLPRYACTRCGSARLAWQDAAGTGAVHAVTEVARAPSEAFRALAPYTLVLVTLAEGPRLMAHAAPGVAIGQRVAATFFQHHERTLVRFMPIAPP
ncbi:Zn-ribbon domain-containing OB-fold protein [Xylophilus sp. GOD-11R]|uniref:Zn-ribbon domain-containing OB-fold protein n=1 Tax=Xylophilus sp. GOD-11R TaxID=3089814 RepID=UPI00298C8E76|nr:OB-fold domain-containing protein [Xylophilus sp. GOD-11R]WPB57336.1 OB-fold domain-containing protein [Xylophilus sp. GOD-11R]